MSPQGSVYSSCTSGLGFATKHGHILSVLQSLGTTRARRVSVPTSAGGAAMSSLTANCAWTARVPARATTATRTTVPSPYRLGLQTLRTNQRRVYAFPPLCRLRTFAVTTLDATLLHSHVSFSQESASESSGEESGSGEPPSQESDTPDVEISEEKQTAVAKPKSPVCKECSNRSLNSSSVTHQGLARWLVVAENEGPPFPPPTPANGRAM